MKIVFAIHREFRPKQFQPMRAALERAVACALDGACVAR